MASTYTVNTGIELIANGEQSGTWGTTTNVNLEIIDRLTNGVGAISLSGTTHTLTTTDGTLSDGQFKVLVFGGSPSGTNTVTISPNDQDKQYFVRNNSGQSIVLSQGSGGNVTIANGRSALVFADGAGAGAAVVDISAGLVPVLTNAGVTATTAELNILDGVTATTAELNFVDGVTSSIQTQLNNKQPLTTTLTAIGALAVTNSNFIVGNGSTWVAETGATARTSLGLGSIATQNSNSVSITGGAITGITDLAVADGGTGVSTVPTNGRLLIGNGSGYTVANITAGTGISVTNGAGSITVAATNNGTVTSVASGTGLTGGPITSSGTLSVATNGITNTLLRDSAALSVVGRSANSVGDPADIAAASDHQVLRRSGTALGFGSINLASTAAVAGTLPVTRGGTGATTSTGTGSVVRATSPALVTPALGTPSSGNLSGCTVDGTNAVGFKNIPQNSRSAAYTLVLADSGKHIFHPSADTTARTFTIPANSSVAFPIGTAITFINQNGAGVITIAITSDTMRLAGDGATGSRTLDANGVATCIKITSTEWIISGNGLS